MIARYRLHCTLQSTTRVQQPESPTSSPSCSKPDRQILPSVPASVPSHVPPPWDLLYLTRLIDRTICDLSWGPTEQEQGSKAVLWQSNPCLGSASLSLSAMCPSFFKFNPLPSQVQDVLVILGAREEAISQLHSEVPAVQKPQQ